MGKIDSKVTLAIVLTVLLALTILAPRPSARVPVVVEIARLQEQRKHVSTAAERETIEREIDRLKFLVEAK